MEITMNIIFEWFGKFVVGVIVLDWLHDMIKRIFTRNNVAKE